MMFDWQLEELATKILNGTANGVDQFIFKQELAYRSSPPNALMAVKVAARPALPATVKQAAKRLGLEPVVEG
jgi:hypothetical protein